MIRDILREVKALEGIQCPDFVILDMQQSMLDIIKTIGVTVAEERVWGLIVNDVMCSILESIRDERISTVALEYTIDSIENNLLNDGQENLMMAVRSLGGAVFNKLKELGLYENGTHHYRLYCWADPFSPVLEKFFDAVD